jgi:integrating conjugative element membrane protein (TIGR03747 family)
VARDIEASRYPVQRGFISGILGSIARVVGWLLAALVFSIVVEWMGMLFWWKDEGPLHSEAMLQQELNYLNDDFRRSVVSSDPARFARRFADNSYHYLFEWTHFVDFARWLQRPPAPNENRFLASIRPVYSRMGDYVVAAMTVTQVFAVRLAVLTLATPVFVLFGLVALVDGLVQRDLRRWAGGRESAFIYHHAKKVVFPAVIFAWVVYLGMPTSIHPNYVILPFAALFALAMAVAAGSFKKYL